MSLPPLSDSETARLVHALLEQSVLPVEVQATLLERAGGNPLYAEEFVRMFGERGGGAELPESVQGIIAARLDGLEAEDKSLLQDAAVVGKVFWSGALAAIGSREQFAVEERLHALERRELVRRERRSSVAGEREYAFRHVLVRDVAYGAIPRAARADRHRAAAEWIESLGRPEDHADLLAHHYLSALELWRAAGIDAGILAGAAATALVTAGDRAFGLNAFEAATRFYDEALSLGIDETERPRVLFRLGSALHLAGDERRVEVLEEARELLTAAADPESAADASLLLADAWWFRGLRDAAQEHLSRARELIAGRAASPTAARVFAQVARHRMLAADVEGATSAARQALALADELGIDEPRILALNALGTARVNAGDEGGIADLELAVEHGLALNSPEAARALNNLASMVYYAGEVERGKKLYERAEEVSERLGNATVGRYIRGAKNWFAFDAGDWDEALAGCDAFIAECEAGSPHYLEAGAHGVRARILLARGDTDGAVEAATRGLALAREAKDPQALRPALSVQLHVQLELGNVLEARATALETLADEGYVIELALAAAPLGLLEETRNALPAHRASPWRDAAAAILGGSPAEAADLLEAIGDRSGEAQVRLRDAKELVAAGRRHEADLQLAKALAFYRSVGATRYIREGEALLARTA